MDEQAAQEETEDKLKQCIDNLMDKRYVYSKFVPTKDASVTINPCCLAPFALPR